MLYDRDGYLCPRCLAELRREGLDQDDRTQIDLESLPTGGWDYGFYPLWARYERTFGRPVSAMTSRFHGPLGRLGWPEAPGRATLRVREILARVGSVFVGDRLHSRGRLDAVEAYCQGASAAAVSDRPIVASIDEAMEGARKALLELHHQFDVITARYPDFGAYRGLVVPARGPLTPEGAARIVTRGGKLLTSHTAPLGAGTGRFALADELGLDYLGPAASVTDDFELNNGERIDVAQRMAGCSNVNTTDLYHHRLDDVTLDEAVRIGI